MSATLAPAGPRELLDRVVRAVGALARSEPEAFLALLDVDAVWRERIAGHAGVRSVGRDEIDALLRSCCRRAPRFSVTEVVVAEASVRVRFDRPWWNPSLGRLVGRLLVVGGHAPLLDVNCSASGISELVFSLGSSSEPFELCVFR